MKWARESKVYMWAVYHSEDGCWKAYDTDIVVKGGSRRTFFNPRTGKQENMDSYKHVWKLTDKRTGKEIPEEFATLKAAKQYAEEIR